MFDQCGTMCDSVKMDGVPETLHRNLFGDKDVLRGKWRFVEHVERSRMAAVRQFDIATCLLDL